MTRFSGRFGTALIVIFALTLAPILWARAIPARDECGSSDALFDHEALYPEIELIMEGPRSTSIERGRLTGIVSPHEPSERMVFTIIRTFGLPNGLVQPAAALPGDREPDVIEEGGIVVGDTTIPIHYASEQASGLMRTTAYFMTHRGVPITSPLLERLRSAPAALVGSRWPITLFVVSTRAHPRNAAKIRPRLDSWIRAAWSRYEAVCPPPSHEDIWRL